MKKQCLECDRSFHGRADKKYCSNACRSATHNRQNRDQLKFVRNINNILRTNRRILAKLNTMGKTKIHRDKLLVRGFQFGFHTHTEQTASSTTCYFCYDHGYQPIEGEFFNLMKKIPIDF